VLCQLTATALSVFHSVCVFPYLKKYKARNTQQRGKTTRLMILHFKFELSISNGIKMTRLKNKTKIKGIGSAVQK
jgi:hypothetical protein